MKKITKLRNKIDKIDYKMAINFEKRMQTIRQILQEKQALGLSIFDIERESEILERNKKVISDDNLQSYYPKFLNSYIELSKEYQSELSNK